MEDLFDPSVTHVATRHQPPNHDELRALIEHVRITEALKQIDAQRHPDSIQDTHTPSAKSDSTPD
jgi:hypothetical protein